MGGDAGEGTGTEVGDLDGCGELFGGGEDALMEAGERHDGAGKLAEFGGLGVAFAFPEGVEHADEGGALAEVIVEFEQLKAGEAGGAQGGLDVFLVALELEAAGGLGEFVEMCIRDR